MNPCLSLITAKAEEEKASLRSWIIALQKQNEETLEEAKINARLRGKKKSDENDRCRKGWRKMSDKRTSTINRNFCPFPSWYWGKSASADLVDI